MKKFFRTVYIILFACMFLVGCGAADQPQPTPHVHTFEGSGICLECGEECLHEFSDGVCSLCGMEEPEPEPEIITPENCTHSFENGVCPVCGYICPHEQDGVPCYEDSLCIICGSECPHSAYTEGICNLCGYAHIHESHLPSESLFAAPVCDVCGAKVLHNWINGSCTVCGEEFVFVEEELPKEIVTSDNTPKGYYHVETFRYPTHFYRLNGEPSMEIEKQMTVYLPPDYDENKTYDLMIMCIGSDTDSKMYFAKRAYYFSAGAIYGAGEMLDNMISGNLCKPFIAVCIDWRSTASNTYTRREEDGMQMACELKNDILPYICENYPVYPQNASDEELAANREHVAFFGVSWGALIINRSALQDNFNVAGWYCAVSGSYVEGEDMAKAIEDREEPIYYYYACDGTMYIDHQAPKAKESYYAFEALSDKVTDGVNGHGSTIKGGRHDITTWLTALFNYSRICFNTEN